MRMIFVGSVSVKLRSNFLQLQPATSYSEKAGFKNQNWGVDHPTHAHIGFNQERFDLDLTTNIPLNTDGIQMSKVRGLTQ